MRKYKRNLTRFNHAFFSEIDTEEKAYWLGFIFADGFILDKMKYGSKQLGVRLAKKDRQQLEIFRLAIGSKNTIHEHTNKKGKISVALFHSSDKLCEDLKKHGCGPRKSLILKFPDNIDANLMPHFIRGYFDGDGCACISDGRLFVGFVGTEHFLEGVKQAIVVNNKLAKRENISTLTFSDKNKCRWFYHYIYDNATVYLQRKKDVFERAKQLYRPGSGNYIRPTKTVLQMNPDGEIVKVWAGSREATAAYGTHVSSVLSGKKKQHKGFIWKYAK